MNESQYLDDVETSETSVFEDSVESDTEAVTEVNYVITDSIGSVSEVTSVSETCVYTSSDYDSLAVVENNTNGILLMTTGIFFLLLIALIAKIFGGYFSM